MIILQRLNVVRKVATEEAADKLVGAGYTRIGGEAESMDGVSIEWEKLSDSLMEKMKQLIVVPAAVEHSDGNPAVSIPPKRGGKAADKEEKTNGTGSDESDHSGGQE